MPLPLDVPSRKHGNWGKSASVDFASFPTYLSCCQLDFYYIQFKWHEHNIAQLCLQCHQDGRVGGDVWRRVLIQLLVQQFPVQHERRWMQVVMVTAVTVANGYRRRLDLLQQQRCVKMFYITNVLLENVLMLNVEVVLPDINKYFKNNDKVAQ